MTESARNGRTRRLRVVRTIQETADAASVVFAVPDADRDRFTYRPGQFLTLRIPSDRTGSVARCYSLASSPDHDPSTELTVTVKRTTDGYGSNWLCDNATQDLEIEVLPPSGAFTPKNLDADFLLFAGGSGITPILSILKSALARGSGQILLVYANRSADAVIFREQLAALATRHPDRLAVVHWLESVQGLPARAQLRTLVAPYADRESFVCGPQPFMAAVTEALQDAGVPKARIRTEAYKSLSGNPFELPAPTTVPTTAAPVSAATAPAPDSAAGPVVGVALEVEIGAATHALTWPPGSPMIDILLGQGLDVPYSCRDGECGSCQATLLKGKVTMLRNEVLGEDDVAEGYILTCQAVPADDHDGGPIAVEF
ncbi:ferredoxin--NADP reductase [Cryptosporangium aurantiacum]|uniref:3-ketosteroid 9alpha-monooxygenase subunit B n=1 Tax=Cryptosporangium aurantiacum TaxID=134849 RepID=A0A1M7PK38_9ACTN|nr:ferredoxin--NADP reductase [Cryptosporangium aurantiacum]SHN17577.1 3-ketosteroid 9alpha-monooxygenase subunit B [Cryptosporangium aurantiacum]